MDFAARMDGSEPEAADSSASDPRPHLVVIGNGMAGCRAVEELLARDPARYRITIFGAEPRVNYNRIMLSPPLAGEKSFDGTGYHNSGFLGLPPEIGQAFGLLGDSYELTFTKAGEYPYYCVLHAGGPDDPQGMAGKVIVQ
mgnify:CR=1 FL=1